MHALLKSGAALGAAIFRKKLMIGLGGLAAIGAIQVLNMFLQQRNEKRRRRSKKIAHAPRLRADKREMYHAPVIPTESLVRH